METENIPDVLNVRTALNLSKQEIIKEYERITNAPTKVFVPFNETAYEKAVTIRAIYGDNYPRLEIVNNKYQQRNTYMNGKKEDYKPKLAYKAHILLDMCEL